MDAETMTPKRYTTITDVVNECVRPALGTFYNEFDLDSIAREIVEYHVDPHSDDPSMGNANTEGYQVYVDDAEFWAVVGRHELA